MSICTCAPIGVLRTPFTTPQAMPIQASEARGKRGFAMIEPPWQAGLADLDGFDRVWLLWWADRAIPASALVTPFRDTRQRGVFATRSPNRPVPIGLSCVKLLGVGPDRIEFDGVDMLDGTPLLDIKPYVWTWDAHPGTRSGWYDAMDLPQAMSDGGFCLG